MQTCNYERITITCPHCYGTGYLEVAKQMNHCVFCDGTGQITVEVEVEQ